eukprot:5013590-Pleurochrysis_carterae.AAC.2
MENEHRGLIDRIASAPLLRRALPHALPCALAHALLSPHARRRRRLSCSAPRLVSPPPLLALFGPFASKARFKDCSAS